MKRVVWKVKYHCADCADKFKDFVRAFPGVKDVNVIIPKESEDKCDFEGKLEFYLNDHLVLEKTIRSEARAEGFEVLT